MGAALPSLVRWGLSPDADLVYRTLVSLDSAREGQLAHELGLPHERIREAVRELADAGAIRRVSSTPRRSAKAAGRTVWAARQPNQVVGHLHIHRPRALRAASSELTAAPAAAEPRRPAAVSGPAREAVTVDEPAAGKGVDTAAPDETNVADAGWAAGPTGLLSTAPAAPQPAGIPAQALPSGIPTQALPAGAPAQDPPGQVPVPPPAHWHPLPASWQSREAPTMAGAELAPREYPQVTLTPRERAIVELLAQGHTDETAARELDLSRRTVGYALGGLMSRLGVDNRFQLGLALGALRAAVPSPRARSEY
jgi:DNA-binding CsgD family transcriptional regulator